MDHYSPNGGLKQALPNSVTRLRTPDLAKSIPNGASSTSLFGDTNAASFLLSSNQIQKQPRFNPLPVSSLRTGFCYDIRMRFHQTVDYRDMHPEDPRRIYRIYKELSLAGLIQDRETQSDDTEELMMRIRARYAIEDEILLVHTPQVLAEMKATQSISTLCLRCLM
jgi:hypothetical protein